MYYLINEIYKRDENPLIVVTADHLPAIFNDKLQYVHDTHMVSAFILDGKRQINVTGKNIYELSWIAWDILTNENHKRPKENLEELYYYYLSQVIN
ncbi:hypothetical protein [Thermodesulfovibrio hydrogeniphilus]